MHMRRSSAMSQIIPSVSPRGSSSNQQIPPEDNQLCNWYRRVQNNKDKYKPAPSYLPTLKESYPYKLIIHQINNLPKRNTTTSCFLRVQSGLITNKLQEIGATAIYQSEYDIGKAAKYDIPVCLYYHSKIDKNFDGIYLWVKLTLLQFKQCTVQTIHQLGYVYIESPFIQIRNQNSPCPMFALPPVEYLSIPVEGRNKLSTNASAVLLQIESTLQYKNLTKLIPENMIVSPHDQITGVGDHYLPEDIGVGISEMEYMEVVVSELQIDIPDKFQQQMLTVFDKIYGAVGDKPTTTTDIKSRRILIGVHNEYHMVAPIVCKLDFVSVSQPSPSQKYSLYAAIHPPAILKIPYYLQTASDSISAVLMISLMYEVGGREIEVGMYIRAMKEGSRGEINESIVTGCGWAAYNRLLPISTDKKPTIIMEYECEEILPEFGGEGKREEYIPDGRYSQQYIKNDRSRVSQNQQQSPSRYERRGSKTLKTSQKSLSRPDSSLQLQRNKLQSQLQKLQLQHLQEKEQLNRLKEQHEGLYLQQFQKKLALEKENLFKRQQLIEMQYKQQVQLQIKEKLRLQEQIRSIKDRLMLQQEDKRYRKGSQQVSENQPNAYPNQSFSPLRQHSGQNYMHSQHAHDHDHNIVQRIDAAYYLKPQPTIPPNKVKQFLKHTTISPQTISQSYNQYMHASKFTFTLSTIEWFAGSTPPATFYFVLHFFNLPSFRSDTLTYLQSADNYNEIIRLSHFTYAYEGKAPSYQFVVDPSTHPYPSKLQRDLVDYLKEHHAIMDLYDGKSHLYLGQINIKLDGVLRGAKDRAVIAKEYTLVKVRQREGYGCIQVMLSNEQEVCQQPLTKEGKKVKDIKTKVISNAPLTVDPHDINPTTTTKSIHCIGQFPSQSLVSSSANLSRQQLRISNFKERAAMSKTTFNSYNTPSHDPSQLAKIQMYKQNTKQQYIKSVYNDLMNQTVEIDAYYGKAAIFHYVVNGGANGSIIRINIIDSGHSPSPSPSLSVIRDARQWRYFVHKYNLPQPKRYDVLNTDMTFHLNAHQSMPLLFKYLSFGVDNDKSKSKSKQTMSVTFLNESSQFLVCGFSLQVNMHPPLIHHSFVLYEPCEREVQLIVPVIYTSNTKSVKKLQVKGEYKSNTDVNASAVVAEWRSQEEIAVTIKTTKPMQLTKCHLLLYEDDYHSQLVEDWLLQIHSYDGVGCLYRSSSVTPLKLLLPFAFIPVGSGSNAGSKSASKSTLTAKTLVRFFSSSPYLTLLQQQMQLIPSKEKGGYGIQCEVRQGVGRNEQVTCVSQSGQLIYAWAIQCFPIK